MVNLRAEGEVHLNHHREVEEARQLEEVGEVHLTEAVGRIPVDYQYCSSECVVSRKSLSKVACTNVVRAVCGVLGLSLLKF